MEYNNVKRRVTRQSDILDVTGCSALSLAKVVCLGLWWEAYVARRIGCSLVNNLKWAESSQPCTKWMTRLPRISKRNFHQLPLLCRSTFFPLPFLYSNDICEGHGQSRLIAVIFCLAVDSISSIFRHHCRGMLALPTRRGQCLFCSFRAAFSSLPKRRPKLNCEFSNTAARKRKLHKSSAFVRPTVSGQKFVGGGRRIPLRNALVDVPLESVGERVRTSLVKLKRQLESTKLSGGSEVTQLMALDPLGTYWPAFKEHLESAVSLPGDAEGAGFDGLVSDIGRAQLGNWKTELPRVLHFGFIDYVLMRKAQETPENGSVLDELKFPTEWYTNARQVQRDVHLHIGPTNSGKTYNALKRLEESGDGIYAGPLRLLAHEVYSRFKAKGKSCDLITGDDVRLENDPTTSLRASTVEMVDLASRFEVAVIDEIQMMADQDRGWAWTRAFLGANAKEVHICGEARVLPLIRELTASTGDILHVHEYKRLNPLKVMSKSLKGDLKSLRKGDCIVAFSVMDIHALKKQVELDTGRRCAIVYGSLPPETRAQQAALFNDPDNDYDFLVASDAIGMGLNL